MSDTPERPSDPTHHPVRIYRLAAFIVFLAGVVFILAVIFWSGFILGACSGGHHGEGRHWQGMLQSSHMVERTVPAVAVYSVGFTG